MSKNIQSYFFSKDRNSSLQKENHSDLHPVKKPRAHQAQYNLPDGTRDSTQPLANTDLNCSSKKKKKLKSQTKDRFF